VEKVLKNTASTYGRTFPLQDKIDVSGSAALPLYKELLDPEESLISWNFHKFLINRKGELTGSYKPKVSPFEMEDDIVSLLKQ
jgi:glutathione peroxidase